MRVATRMHAFTFRFQASGPKDTQAIGDRPHGSDGLNGIQHWLSRDDASHGTAIQEQASISPKTLMAALSVSESTCMPRAFTPGYRWHSLLAWTEPIEKVSIDHA